jgi:hypothetical protein
MTLWMIKILTQMKTLTGILHTEGCEYGTNFLKCIKVLKCQVRHTRYSLSWLIRRPGSFLEYRVGTHCGSPRQTEGHSFGDHPISESVRVAP